MYDRSAGPSDLQFSARLLERSEEPVLSQSLQSVCFLSFRNVVLLSHMQPFACNRVLLFWISARWAQCDTANPYMSWLIWNDTRVHSAPPPKKKGFGLTETKWILKNRSKMSWSIQCPKFELNCCISSVTLLHLSFVFCFFLSPELYPWLLILCHKLPFCLSPSPAGSLWWGSASSACAF